MSDARLRELAARLAEMTPASPPPPTGRRMQPPRRAWVAVAAAGAVAFAIMVPALLFGGGSSPTLETTTIDTSTPRLQTTTTIAPIATTGQSAEVATTLPTATGDLDSWREQWEASRPDDYFISGEVTCDGECGGGLSAHKIDSFVLGEAIGGDAPSVDELFDLVASVGADQMNVSFDPELGYPSRAVWGVNGSTTTIVVSVAPINPGIDGVWLLESGEVGGQEIETPDGDPIEVRIGTGIIRFPLACNRAGGRFTLDGSAFHLVDVFQTDVGCPEDSIRAAMFVEAITQATQADRVGEALVLSGPSTELTFALVDSGRSPFWGAIKSIMPGEDYAGSGSPGDYRVGSASFQIDRSFAGVEDTFLFRNTPSPQVCADFPIEGEVVTRDACFVVGALNAVGFPSEIRIFAQGPLPDGNGDGVWTLARRLETTESGNLDVDNGVVVLTVGSEAAIDCPAAASIEDLASIDADMVVQIDPETADVIRVSCR